jgi:hypothetical protein
MSTEALLQEIVTELRQIRLALGGGAKAPAQQPKQSGPINSGNGGGSQYAKREDEKFATCNRCGAANVIWRKSKAGKSYLVNPDGAYHSATCNK